MKQMRIDIPDQLAAEVAALVTAGWFGSTDEVARFALTELVHRHRFELLERFQREDIAWALREHDSAE